MGNYLLTYKAVEDLSNIWNYSYEVWSESQADKYYHMLLNACQRLADKKVAGRNYAEISKDVLGFKVGQHIIFYRKLQNNGIEIVRILHKRMDLKSRIDD